MGQIQQLSKKQIGVSVYILSNIHMKDIKSVKVRPNTSLKTELPDCVILKVCQDD